VSDTPGWGRPEDESPAPPPGQPPYPGWSTRQPPSPGWAAPGQAPADPAGPAGPPTGPTPGDWGTPPAPSAAAWGWAPPPVVKPGVIPLRPLGVGEILDGAVTTIRRNPAPMLGLSAIVAVLTQLLGVGLGYLFLQDMADLASLSPTAGPGEVLSALAGVIGASAIVVIVTWIATVILTGILTVVVSRAVLGERPTVGEAWTAARRRLPRLLLLTVVYSLIWLAPFLLATALALLLLAAGASGEVAAGIGAIVGLLAVPVAIWLYVRYALSGPTLMLESAPSATGDSRPIGVVGALRRSAALVRGSWWRLFGILLLILLIAGIISQVISVPFALPALFIDEQPTDSQFLLTLIVSAVGGIVAATITAPFTAAATALLYVDRRIRREGLDIELARAAGLSIPGRTDVAAPPPAPGPA
jgi:hypothetical protein